MNDVLNCWDKDIVRSSRPNTMSNIRGALVPILLVGFVPTLSILFSLRFSDDETLSQVFFIVCKAWIFLLPTYWFLRAQKNDAAHAKDGTPFTY